MSIQVENIKLIILSITTLFYGNCFATQGRSENDYLPVIGSYDQKTDETATLRSDIGFFCHGIILYYARIEHPPDVSVLGLASQEIAEDGIPDHILTTRDFRFSSSCTHLIVVGLFLKDNLDRQWMHRKLDGTKLRQEWVQFHFVNEPPALAQLFTHPAIQAIKFKTAIPVDDFVEMFSDKGWFDRNSGGSGPENVLPSHSKIRLKVGSKVNIADVNVEPYISKDREGRVNGGFTHSLSLTVCKHFNLSCNHILAYKGFSRLPNGTWTGYMWDLTDGDLDIFGLLGHSLQRHGHVDFTSTYYHVSLNFYTAHPAVSIKWVALLYPFSPSLWALTGIASALVIPMLYAQSKVRQRTTDGKHRDALFEAVWFPFATLLQIGVNIPRHTETLSTFFMAFALIVFTAYNSDLMSYLTWPEPDIIPRTWTELAQMRHLYNITFHYLPGFESVKFMNETTDADLLKIRSSMVNDKDRLRCSFAAAGETNTVCIQYNIIVELATKKNLTLHSSFEPLLVSRESALKIPMAMLMRRHTKYYEFWNEKVGLLRDTGHTMRWFADSLNSARIRSIPWMQEQKEKGTKLFRKLTQAFQNTNPGVQQFSVYNFTLASLVLSGGCVLGMITFIQEILFGQRAKRNLGVKLSEHSIVPALPRNAIQSPMLISVSYLK